ncbi:N-acetylmuramoyl-L-alanine amidase, partial [Pantoea dispersa]
HEALDRSLEPASDDPTRQVQRKRDPGPRFPWPQVLEAVALAPYAPSADRAPS